ncbi:MAG: hypothetical protein HGB04_05140 [Chlorobiaceae bacterium]|nr:hypothetical protein [Chlorobiaceae bacterium]
MSATVVKSGGNVMTEGPLQDNTTTIGSRAATDERDRIRIIEETTQCGLMNRQADFFVIMDESNGFPRLRFT